MTDPTTIRAYADILRRTPTHAGARAVWDGIPEADLRAVGRLYWGPVDEVEAEEPKAAPAKPVRQPGTPRTPKPTAAQIGFVLTHIEFNPTATAREIARAQNLDTKIVSAALLKLVKAREVVKTGRSYTAVTVARDTNGAAEHGAEA
jgi:hypothetical protein